MKSISDLGRLLFAIGMALGGASLLGLLAFHVFGLQTSSVLWPKIIIGVVLTVFAFVLFKGLQKLFDRFRAKCKTERDFWMIMLSFSLAGMFIMPVRMLIFHLIGIKTTTPFWIKVLVYIPIVPPAYYMGLLIVGSLLGQSSFFMGMIQSRLRFLTGRKNI